MRNLKKVLALVLALAMALSVMASAFTAPEYSEEAQAEYDAMTAAQQNAFYVVSALGIVEGFSDGSFRPEENLTRAQFAAMVYRAKTGDVAKENTLFSSASVAMFSDAIDTWAIPYVAYAYSAGIVAGYPDGTFKATKAVTGLEAAKMLLTALGYDAEIEGLVGPTFYANTIKLGTAVGLFNGVKGDIYAPATRADAFVMFANALKANTVSYVGGVATPKTETLNSEDIITLGEEGFDLLDVEAILVATEDAALGAYWRNVITAGNAYGIEYENYQAAPAGYARFVYRDYVATDAANKGANYYDRVITVALGDQAAKFVELGSKYRLLVTDLSPVYNENEFRVLYGVPVAIDDAADLYYTETKGEVNALAASTVDAMAKRYATVNALEFIAYGDLTADNEAAWKAVWEAKDSTTWVNGATATFKAARELCKKNTTAPYKAVDNDNDGVVDALFISEYTLAIVKAVAEDSVTFQGTGLGKKTVANAADFAVGDYAAVWSDTDGFYAKKLEVKEANVTGWNGSKFTIDGKDYGWSKYVSDESKSLVGKNANALTETVYKFVFDGSYIVNVEFTENTRYAKYAIVEEVGNPLSNYLHYPHVTLYTEDNEYVTAYVKTVNGVQVYDYQNQFGVDTFEGELVSYKLDGDYVYIDTLVDDNATAGEIGDGVTFDGNKISISYEFAYNRATDTWEGLTTNGIVPFKDTYGVVFVSYTGANGRHVAYLDGEFMPSYYNENEAKKRDAVANDVVVYVEQNGVNFIKAAVINFNHIEEGYVLPGLPTTRTGEELAIVKSTSVKVVDGQYIYTYTVYDANNNTTSTRESAPFAWAQTMPTANEVVVFKTNNEGKVTYFEEIGLGLKDTVTGYEGTRNFELRALTAAGINLNPTNAIIALSDVVDTASGAQYVSYPINYSEDADIWYFSIDKDGVVSQKSFYDINYDYNNASANKNYVVYVDLNETTQTAQRIIVITGAWLDNRIDSWNTVTLNVTGTYDPDTKKISYSSVDTGSVPADLALVADKLLAEYATSADDKTYPWDVEFAAGATVKVTFENIDGIWTVKSVKGFDEAKLYSNSIAKIGDYEAIDGLQYADLDATAGLTFKIDDDYVNAHQITKVFAYRTYNDRLDLVWTNKAADADKAHTTSFADVANISNIDFSYGTTADAKVNLFEGFFVIKSLEKVNATEYGYVIVLVDDTVGTTDTNKFPYADVNAAGYTPVDPSDDNPDQSGIIL